MRNDGQSRTVGGGLLPAVWQQVLAALIFLIGLGGFVWSVLPETHTAERLASMRLTAGLGSALFGAALLLYHPSPYHRARPRAAMWLGLAVGLLALAIIVFHALDIPWQAPWFKPGSADPMGMDAALCFLLATVALTWGMQPSGERREVALISGMTLCLISGAVLMGYVAGVDAVHRWGDVRRMSAYTALVFQLIGLWFVVERRHSLMGVRSHWSTVLGGATVAGLSVLLWYGLLENRRERLLLESEEAASSELRAVGHELRLISQSLSRFARRWNSGCEESRSPCWQDLRRYLNDFRQQNAMGWIDPDSGRELIFWKEGTNQPRREETTRAWLPFLTGWLPGPGQTTSVLQKSEGSAPMLIFAARGATESSPVILAFFPAEKLLRSMVETRHAAGYPIEVRMNGDSLLRLDVPTVPEGTSVEKEATIVGRRWKVRAGPSDRSLHSSTASDLVLFSGALIACLLMINLHLADVATERSAAIAVLNDELERRVKDRTQELQASLEELKRSEDRFTSLMTATSQVIWTNNSNGEMVGGQGDWAQLTGQTRAEYEGSGWLGAIHPEDRERTKCTWQRSMAAKTPLEVEHRVRCADGRYRHFWVRAVPVIEQSGQVREWVGVHHDITERKQTVEALLDSEEQFRQLADSMPQLVWITDQNGNAEYVNRQWSKYTGMRPDESWENHIAKVVHPGDYERREERWGEALKTGEMFESEHRLRRYTGEYRWHLARSQPIRDAEGRVVRWFGTATDIEEQKRAEELLEARVLERTKELAEKKMEAERASRTKSEFLANMSHELRTPLNAVVGFTDMIADGYAGEVNEVQREYLGEVQSSARHLLDLINDLLDLARIEAGRMEANPEVLDPREVVGDVANGLQPLAMERRIVLRSHVAADLRSCQTDRRLLRQVLYNYVSNALKFTQENGSVDVRVRRDGFSHFILEVHDTGIGISADDADRLFRKFEQLNAGSTKKYAGTGLGLALVKSIVEMQGGEVGVRSVLGKGSVFYARLPVEASVNALR